MLESASRSTPPPIPNTADHVRPTSALHSSQSQELPRTLIIHHDIMIPDLTVKEWTLRLLKPALALIVVGIAMLLPLLVYLLVYAAAMTKLKQ